jgi:hypothetical protein
MHDVSALFFGIAAFQRPHFLQYVTEPGTKPAADQRRSAAIERLSVERPQWFNDSRQHAHRQRYEHSD